MNSNLKNQKSTSKLLNLTSIQSPQQLKFTHSIDQNENNKKFLNSFKCEKIAISTRSQTIYILLRGHSRQILGHNQHVYDLDDSLIDYPTKNNKIIFTQARATKTKFFNIFFSFENFCVIFFGSAVCVVSGNVI